MKFMNTVTGVILMSVVSARAEIKMPAFFSDGMVLQQEIGAKVWGFGVTGETVNVEFSGQKLNATTSDDGKWEVNFKDLKASKIGQVLTVSSGGEKREIKNVLVGEVWIASGQSNMEWTMNKTHSAAEAKIAKDELLRIYVTKNITAASPAKDFAGNWKETDPKNNGRFTAVGYEYAKVLRERLDVPVGIIECAWGGKPVEAFTRDEAFRKIPEAKNLVVKKEGLMKQWKKLREAKEPKPTKMKNPELNDRLHSTIYNGMIAPIAGYGARGVIWYQGESNANPESANHYGELLKGMILDWRAQWGSELSFYYVQLANYNRNKKDGPLWVTVQDEMRRLLDECPRVGMAVINDIGDAKDIHPKNKKDVADRLARWALSKDYGVEKVVLSGPLYKSHKIVNDGLQLEVSFEHAVGLNAREGKELGGFELQDMEGNWKSAKAMIKAGKVIVSHSDIKKIKNVRYAWQSNPKSANLVNAEGLPTSCFIGEE